MAAFSVATPKAWHNPKSTTWFLCGPEQIAEEPWKPKGKNAEKRREAFVFLDDNPMEVESVRQHLPEVTCSGEWAGTQMPWVCELLLRS